ncbi:MAG: RNA methyltransferase [Candidatus Dojkabacteria bacterium]|nr:RNA methyltransferase [Candidatus Dojkabacteria bacterium]
MAKAYKKYRKNFDYSYTLGIYPTIELLRNKPDQVLEIFLKSNLIENKGSNEILRICQESGISYSINDNVIKRLSFKENVYAVGLFKKYNSCIEKKQNRVVLLSPTNTGNLGTIIRTSLGFNVKNIGMIFPGVDIFDPEVIRASMGALFRINFQYFDNIQSLPQDTSIYLFYTDGEQILSKLTFYVPFTLVFGSEGPGLPESAKRLGQAVRIPQSDNVDSFNLGVSVGIALYEATKNSF